MPFISTDSVKNSPCQLCYTALVSRSIFWRLAMSCRIWGHKIISCSSLPLALEMFTTWLETVFRRRMRRTRTSRRWRILQISSTARNLFKRKGHTTSDYIYNMALEPLIPPLGTWWLSRGESEVSPDPQEFRIHFCLVDLDPGSNVWNLLKVSIGILLFFPNFSRIFQVSDYLQHKLRPSF